MGILLRCNYQDGELLCLTWFIQWDVKTSLRKLRMVFLWLFIYLTHEEGTITLNDQIIPLAT